MIILDTNVVSEMMKDECDPGVLGWNSAQPETELYLTSITVAEIMFGIDVLPPGKKQRGLLARAEKLLRESLADRILPFDDDAAFSYATLAAERRRNGLPVAKFDLQIAAIAKARGTALATRNIRDFTGCGLTLIDPWIAS